MSAHQSKSYFRNIRLNLLSCPHENDTTLANAIIQFRSADSPDKARSNCFEIINAILQNFSNDQVDFVFTVRINSTKHQEYFADHRAEQDKRNHRNQTYIEKKRQERIAAGNPPREFATKTYHPHSHKRILAPKNNSDET